MCGFYNFHSFYTNENVFICWLIVKPFIVISFSFIIFISAAHMGVIKKKKPPPWMAFSGPKNERFGVYAG